MSAHGKQRAADDLKSVAAMIEHAEREGLLAEVVWSFGIKRKGGDDTPTAASAALTEWDI